MRPRFDLERHAYPVLEAECAARGIATYHTHDSRRSAEGFPDYVIPLGRWLMHAELKKTGGSLRPDQAEWLLRLRGPWRMSLLVDVNELDALMLAIDNAKAGRLDAIGPAGVVKVLVLGDVRRWALLGSEVDGECVRRAAAAAAADGPTRPPRHRRDTRRRARGS